MRATLITLITTIVLTLGSAASVTAASADADDDNQSAGEIQQLTLTDGSRLYGHVESSSDAEIVFRSIADVVLTIPRARVKDVRTVSGDIVAGEFRKADPHNTRLFFAPTGRSLRRGQGSFGTYDVFFPFVQVGITDRLSIGGGTPLFFAGDFHPVWITPKLQVIDRERLQTSVGVLHITGTGGHDAGIAYAVATAGRTDNAGTIGFGYAYSGRDRQAIVMAGAESRVSSHVKLMTENWFFPGHSALLSGGFRFLGARVTADLSLIFPVTEDAFVFPMASFAWSF